MADRLLGGCNGYGFCSQPSHTAGSKEISGLIEPPPSARRPSSPIRQVPIPLARPEQASPPSVSDLSSSSTLFPMKKHMPINGRVARKRAASPNPCQTRLISKFTHFYHKYPGE